VQKKFSAPVLTITNFQNGGKKVIEKANNIPYGLSGGVWTDKAQKFSKVTSHKIRSRGGMGEHV